MTVRARNYFCLFLSAIFVFCMLTSCDNSSPNDTENTTSSEPTYPAPDFSDIASPLSVNGTEISYEEFRYYFLMLKEQYDAGSDYYWEDHDYSDKIRENAVSYIRNVYAMLELADSYDILITDYQKSQILTEIQAAKESYDNINLYYKALDSLHLTESFCETVYIQNAIRSNLFAYLTSSESGPVIKSSENLIYKYIDKYVIRAQHILIKNDAGEDMNENKTLVNQIYEQLQNGADFIELMTKYSEDTEMNSKDSVGYYFADGDLGAEFEEAAYALEENEMSGIVEAPYGYHIILRLPLDYEYIEKNLDEQFLNLYQTHMLSIEIKKLEEKQEIVYSDAFSSYTVFNVK